MVRGQSSREDAYTCARACIISSSQQCQRRECPGSLIGSPRNAVEGEEEVAGLPLTVCYNLPPMFALMTRTLLISFN